MSDAPTPTEKSAADPMALPPLPEKVDVIVCVFTYNSFCHVDLLTYTHMVTQQLQNHPRVGMVKIASSHGYPTDRVRNAVLKEAHKCGYHFALMLDDDMKPDLLLSDPKAGAVPFAPTAIDFALAHDGPCFVGAPYCAGPPYQEVVVMKNRERFPDQPDKSGHALDKYTRDEAAGMSGVGEVAALPTGCLLVDTRVTQILPPPWFSYEYADPPYNTALASTEDVVFTRNAHWCGVRQFCTWSSWSGHWKRLLTGKPRVCAVDEIPVEIHRAWAAGWRPKAAVVS